MKNIILTIGITTLLVGYSYAQESTYQKAAIDINEDLMHLYGKINVQTSLNTRDFKTQLIAINDKIFAYRESVLGAIKTSANKNSTDRQKELHKSLELQKYNDYIYRCIEDLFRIITEIRNDKESPLTSNNIKLVTVIMQEIDIYRDNFSILNK